MENHNSAEVASQEDPIVMYLIVREQLNMSPGKLGAQVGHAVQLLMQKQQKIWRTGDHTCLFFPTTDPITGILINDAVARKNFFLFEEWLHNQKYIKVLLGADEKEWQKLKDTLDVNYRVVVVDLGHTELAPNTETVIGLFPMKKSERPKLVKRLQALK